MKRELQIVKNKETDQHALCDELCDRIKGLILDLPYGNWVLNIERKRSQRSISQNKLMWKWFSVIASEWSDAMGYVITPQNVHDAYAEMFLPVTLPNGNRVAGSTSGLSTEQMTEFLNKVQADAATEYGIQLPTPDDLRFEDWMKQYE